MEKKFRKLLVLAGTVLMATSCGGKTGGDGELTGTAKAVKEASSMTYEQLAAAAQAEMEASTDTFKVLGLTSVLGKALTALTTNFPWLEGKTYVKNDYKDYTLLNALEPAETNYVADYALTQDERSIADFSRSGILHNYVPKDYASVGLTEADTVPLKGIHFNKIFWTNTNFQAVTGKNLTNIWQMTSAKLPNGEDDPNHLAKVSFQDPRTEQINMSFLVSCIAPANQARIEAAYQSYYGQAWSSTTYPSAGYQWVVEFLNNVSTSGRWHDSDGSCMKQYQLKDDWQDGYVYFGAYSKMKDAAGKYYARPEGMTDEVYNALKQPEGTMIDTGKKNDDGTAKMEDVSGKIRAMDTVKWDYEVEGFDGYFYTMDSQIANNAKHPYMACLFARYLLEGSFYKSAIYNSSTPNRDGGKGNQYGYYYPGDMPDYSATETKPTTNGYDWTKAKWKQVSLVEDYSYLKSVKSATVAYFQSLVKISN